MSQSNGNLNCVEKCERILKWADDKYPEMNFDTAFVEDLLSRLQGGRTPTEKQERAINNIYTKFHIEKHFENMESDTSDPSPPGDGPGSSPVVDSECPMCFSPMTVIDNEYPYWCKYCRMKFKKPTLPTEAFLFGPKD